MKEVKGEGWKRWKVKVERGERWRLKEVKGEGWKVKGEGDYIKIFYSHNYATFGNI